MIAHHSHSVDFIQNKNIKLLFTTVIALGALSAFLVWVDSRKHHKLKGDIMNLEKQIKELELSKLQNGKS